MAQRFSMMNCLSTLTALCFVFCTPLSAEAKPDLNLDALLDEVRNTRQEQVQFDRRREIEFKTKKDEQAALLATAREELAEQKRINDDLTSRYDENEKALSELEQALRLRSGDLGEIFGTVRSAAGELSAGLAESLISAQFPGRSEALDRIAKSTRFPNAASLEELWYALLLEMTEAGKVARFESEVIDTKGRKTPREVIRIGSFNAISEDLYLRYLNETELLSIPARQPEYSARRLANRFFQARGTLVPVAVDPTRGMLVSMLKDRTTIPERLSQGGWIGYMIMGLGLIGVLVALLRAFRLSRVSAAVRRQLDCLDEPAQLDNPLGRVLAAAERDDSGDSVQEVESRLDEAILKEHPSLERGQSLIKLIAATAPLLGLLGTVTGMIDTFQSITIFGTGDPKLMASGISKALVTTMLGLIVAIPLLFLHSLLLSKSQALMQILYQQSAGLVVVRSERSRRNGIPDTQQGLGNRTSSVTVQ